jgi:hypothetical protein
MRARFVIIPVLLVLISTTVVAHAQHAARPASSPTALQPVPKETRRVYYGGEVLLCDLASVLLLFGGVTAPIGAGGYLLGGPIVHARHGNPERAVASAALRLALPVVGGSVGLAVYDSKEPIGAVLFAFAGGMIGALGAMAIDSAALSWEERPVPAQRPLVVVPQVSLGEHGVSLGVLGRF